MFPSRHILGYISGVEQGVCVCFKKYNFGNASEINHSNQAASVFGSYIKV